VLVAAWGHKQRLLGSLEKLHAVHWLDLSADVNAHTQFVFHHTPGCIPAPQSARP
jgi:hypothetical protein